jgi:hypothetical protein
MPGCAVSHAILVFCKNGHLAPFDSLVRTAQFDDHFDVNGLYYVCSVGGSLKRLAP